MPGEYQNTHCASIEVTVPVEQAYEFMADGMQQDHWALGSMNRRALGENLFVGTSSFSGEEVYVRLDGHPDLRMVDYYIGSSPDALVPLVEARIKPGAVLGLPAEHSVIALTIWRWSEATTATWELHYHLWRTEIHLIKSALERGL
jgi:hypothetical protein